ncbi:phage tail sheath subtilisin-like domain-containing protein [Actinoplanes solisilvae]|uniref:phage tail sheath subtilisin-like domain-containing protein n=1 Tax=Actinoplanes solisilvae TaxID=2486853 RepID=UPI0013E2F9EA|nr:phage tail sheath subtilisin-like domain-containing protein [Actinoplanes solisilvae]
MTSAIGLRLGAPGIYPAPAQRAAPALRPVRLDVCGFVGVAPRGPVDTAVPVQSWSDYLRRFGGFRYGGEQLAWPGRLPFAVQAFFAQGGVKAYVVRVAPVTGGAARARHRLPVAGGLDVLARDEGSWGDRLTVRLTFDTTQHWRAPLGEGIEVEVPDGVTAPPGTLLRLRRDGLAPAGELRWIVARAHRTTPGGGHRPVAVLDRPLPPSTAAGTTLAVVTATVVVDDADPEFARQERFTGLGLRAGHPRFLPDVLRDESLLVAPAGDWPEQVPPPHPLLRAVTSVPVDGARGADRHDLITGASFFDDDDPDTSAPAALAADDDPLDEACHRGVDVIARVDEIGLLVVPDLAWTWTPEQIETVHTRPEGTGCFRPRGPDPAPLTFVDVSAGQSLLDGEHLINRQLRVVARAEQRRRFVALLDVPSRLSQSAIGQWRARFDSSFAAAYHPWLGMIRADDPRRRAVPVPPSAFAAGIIAAREHRLGIPFGPANELALGAVTAADPVRDADHDRLHLLGVNVFRAERDGFRLTAARTLSGDPDYRQLSVRRLITMLRLALTRQAQVLVFEPSTPALQTLLRDTLTQFLRRLYRGGAFVGDTEQDAFFVHCDAGLNPPSSLALGRLIAEVGVAPAEPIEYIVLRISQNADGVVSVEADRV